MPHPIAQLARKSRLRVAGLMSGTSADGIDAAIVDIYRRRVQLVAMASFPFPASIRRQIFKLFDPATSRVDDLCHLNFALGHLFADAVIHAAQKHRIPLDSIDLIGSHGQTVYHIPTARAVPGSPRRTTRSTLQIGEPSIIARRTGIVTVADFRPADVAAGGHGAPLVPFADHFLFAHRTRARVIQNIGGIANLTFLPASGSLNDLLAFDTGPGNMMIDRAASLATAGRLSFDKDGRLAAKGSVDPGLLTQLMRHPFLRRKPPKTTGREQFGTQFTDRIYHKALRRLTPADIVATFTAFTARSIAEAYRRFLPAAVNEVILCGGGARNPVLMQMLKEALAAASGLLRIPTWRLIDDLGFPSEAKEAISFAILAAQTIRAQPSNVSSATGATTSAILGKVVLP